MNTYYKFHDIFTTKRDEMNKKFDESIDFDDMLEKMYYGLVRSADYHDFKEILTYRIPIYLDYKFTIEKAKRTILVLKMCCLYCSNNNFEILDVINKINTRIEKHNALIQAGLNKHFPSELSKQISKFI